MAKQLTYKSLDNLGVNGLNTQANPASLDSTWLTKADNIVIRESGRISSRKGLKQNILKTSAKIGSMVEHNDSGTNKVFASVGTSIYTIAFSSPDSAFTSAHTVLGSTSDWQFVNFNNKLYGFQNGVAPVEYSGSWTNMSTKPSSVSGTFDPSCATGYYGRLWVGGVTENNDVMYYSDTLLGTTWSGGSSGYIDLKTVWDADEIVAIAPFYGQLVIFGKSNIAIYQTPTDPTNMSLTEVIRGIGCVSRDSVQAIGDDLVFLSSTGLRSLARTTELDKVPLTDFSVNIKDQIIRHISQSTNVKSVYVENEGVYVMSFVDLNITYVFDMKYFTPNRAPRVTIWKFDADREPASFAYTESKDFLIGQQQGSIATYEGYYDKDYSGSTIYTSHSYTSSFATNWIDLGDSVVASLLKKLTMVIEGGSGSNLGIKWYKDFSPTPSKTTQITLNPVTTGTVSLWGASSSIYGTTTVTTVTAGSFVVDTYYTIKTVGNTNFTLVGAASNTVGVIFKATGVGSGTGTAESHTHDSTIHPASSTYAPVYGLREYNTSLTGSAKHLKLEMDIEINGFVASLQDATLLHKQGKIR